MLCIAVPMSARGWPPRPLASTPRARCRSGAAAAADPLPWLTLTAYARACCCRIAASQVVAEDAAASEVLEADEYDAATQDSLGYAREIVTRAVDGAAGKVTPRAG